MKSVALYGFAPVSRDGIWKSQADEVWSIVWAYKYNLPRLDRLLEIHPIWLQAKSEKPEYIKAREHWEWMKQNTTIPIYMTVLHPEIPMSVCYPLEGVQSLIPPARRKSVLTSSFDYLMALAVYEGYKRIEAYGFEMGSDTEFRYQREGASYWIGYCDAKGIDLVLPEKTALLSKRLYGYEGGSMIYRQDLERMRETRQQQKRDAFARIAHLEGQVKAFRELGDAEKLAEVEAELENQFRLALVISGALQECEYYIKEIDLEEPDIELINPIVSIPLESK